MKPTFAIYRILGNELPPRDTPGGRLRSLDYILANEPKFPDTDKWWIINRVHAPDLAASYMARLTAANQHFIVLPPTGSNLLKLSGRDLEREAIGVNVARNMAAKLGRLHARFAVVLDGDCYFKPEQWWTFHKTVIDDGTSHAYYSVPSRRSTTEGEKLAALGESMVVFRDDATLRFDESRNIDHQDKIELLWRLGHDQNDILRLRPDALTMLAGEVTHLATGEVETELIPSQRHALRRTSLERLAASMAQRYTGAKPKLEITRNDWERIPGMFNYATTFNHAVLDAPSPAHFVEIGCWRGRSTAYLAQAIRDSGKTIRLDAVDIWKINPAGSIAQANLLQEMGGVDRLYEMFLDNMRSAGLADIVRPIQSDSVAAAARYDDESLDFVFIDGDHSYAGATGDLAAWYPKVRPGGLIAGHDYVADFPGVVQAVDQFFANKPLELRPYSCVWKHRK